MSISSTPVTQEFIQENLKFLEPDKSLGLIHNASLSPVLFAKLFLGIKLYAWQISFLNQVLQAVNKETDKREFVAITSRQIGKSTCLAIFSLWACVFNKYPGTVSNQTLVGIASASDVQAKKLLYEMKKMIRISDKYVEDTYKDKEGNPVWKEILTSLLDDKEPNNTTTVTFRAHRENDGEFFLKGSKSGSVIKSYPPTSAVLGETFSIVVIDEAGWSDKITDQFFYDFMQPTGNSTNAIRIYTSTPWASAGFFYRLVDPDDMYPDAGIILCQFSIDAIQLENPEYYNVVQKRIQKYQEDGKLDEVQRAYYCRFVKGETSYFEPDKVLKVFNPELTRLWDYSKECDMGIDFGGQVTSRTVITISTMNPDGIQRLYHKVYDVQKDLSLIEDVQYLLKKFNIQRIIVDDCPAGDFLIRLMEEKGWTIQRMNFRAEKVKKYGAFRSQLNKNKIQSYPDNDLKTEMLSMEFSNGSKQSILQHAPGYTDDLIDSFVMSTYFYVTDEESVKIFDMEKYIQSKKTKGCQACGSDNIQDTVCKDCGWVQRLVSE